MANYKSDPDNLSSVIQIIVKDKVEQAGWEAESRAVRAANELRTATMHVLRGQRHGRRYIVPGTGRVTYRKGKRQKIGIQYDYVNHTASYIYGHPDATAKITYKHYTASAPGEPPAVRTGIFRASWKSRAYTDGRNGADRVIHGVAESDYKVSGTHLLGDLLENGTSRMAPRPYKQKVIDKAYPKVLKIYREPYFRG